MEVINRDRFGNAGSNLFVCVGQYENNTNYINCIFGMRSNGSGNATLEIPFIDRNFASIISSGYAQDTVSLDDVTVSRNKRYITISHGNCEFNIPVEYADRIGEWLIKKFDHYRVDIRENS